MNTTWCTTVLLTIVRSNTFFIQLKSVALRVILWEAKNSKHPSFIGEVNRRSHFPLDHFIIICILKLGIFTIHDLYIQFFPLGARVNYICSKCMFSRT